MAYPYPDDPEATTPYYQPRRITPRTAGSARYGGRPSHGTSPFDSNGYSGGHGGSGIAGAGSHSGGGSGGGSKIAGADWAGAAIGAAGLASNIYGMTQQKFNFGDVQQLQTDPNSAPSYTTGDMYNQVSGAKPKGASGGEVLGGAAQGAAAGSSILPGIGTAVGAVAGALGSWLGGAARKNAQDTEKNRKMTEVQMAQGKFNNQAEQYKMQQNQLYDYYNRNNAEGREYNVYKSRMNA